MKAVIEILGGAQPAVVSEAILGNQVIAKELEKSSMYVWETEVFIDPYEAVDFAEEVRLNMEAFNVPEAFYKITVEFERSSK